MPMPKAQTGPLTADRLRELLSYDPATGQFTRLVTTSARSVKGTVAGGPDSHGYWRISVDHRRYLAHRLAWFYAHGEWPEEIDHINRVRTDNRLENLRPADTFTNKRNTPAYKSNRVGFKGVSWHVCSKKWRSRIRIDGREVNLGLYDTPVEANAAYERAAREHFGEFARAG